MIQLQVALLKVYEQLLVKLLPLLAQFKSLYQLERKMELESRVSRNVVWWHTSVGWEGVVGFAFSAGGRMLATGPVEWMSELCGAKARKVKPEGEEPDGSWGAGGRNKGKLHCFVRLGHVILSRV